MIDGKDAQFMAEKQNVVVIGSSGHAKVVVDIIEKEGRYAIAGLIDTFKPVGEMVYGYKVLGSEEFLPTLMANGGVYGGVIAIGDNWARSVIAEKIHSLAPEFIFITVIHPAAVVGRGVNIGAGTVLMAGAIVNSDSRVGEFCILNTGCSLDHDSLMGDYSSLAPGAAAGGNVTIGRFTAVSIGAHITHGISIGEHTVLGAGALALKNIPDHCVAYGIPANVIRKRNEGERYL